MTAPTVGRVVLVRLPESQVATNNHSPIAPGVITRVFLRQGDSAKVNVKVLNDSSESTWLTSVPFTDTPTGDVNDAPPFTCFFPPRV